MVESFFSRVRSVESDVFVQSGESIMRKLILAAAGLAALIPVTGASAQYYGGRGYDRGHHYGWSNNELAREIRECRRELRRADSRREYRRERRECQREIARARYESRYGYGDRYDRRYRDRYYRGW